MNSGGEPERDDTGLPPVDIEIPDDARELDRDVQAYFRELRAERRRQRHGRMHGSLARDGLVLPLLACCLILALITGTLLTVFTATSDQNLVGPLGSGASSNPARGGSSSAATGPSSPGAGSSGSAPTAPASGARATTTPVHLPAVGVMVNGRQMFLPNMAQIMLVLVPRQCHCTTAVTRLTRISARANRGTVLVGTPGTIAEAQRLQSRLNPSVSTNVFAGFDGRGALQRVVSASGLTAVVISSANPPGGGESVTYARDLTASDLTANNRPLSTALVYALTH